LFAIPPLYCAYSIFPKLCRMGFLIVDVSSNFVMIGTLRCHDEIEGILWTTATRLCCSARAGIMVSSHDPLQNNTNVLFSRELFLDCLSISYRKIHISDQK
jgi:hypothetical protein